MSVEKFRNTIFNQKKEEVVRFLQTYDVNTPQKDLGPVYVEFELHTFHGEKKSGQHHDNNIIDESVEQKEIKKDVIEKEQLADYIFYGSTKSERHLYEHCEKKYGDDFPWTPLQYACAAEKGDMIRLLIERGGDLTIRDATGRDCFQICEFLKRDRALKILKTFKK